MGKKSSDRSLELPNGERMEDPDDDGNKYFGILKMDNIFYREM